ncbi:MAG: hypothetical protein WBC06_19180 [Chitinophagaceae bacterium]
MTQELLVLLLTTVSIAFIHTLTGPDHYLPFIVIAKAKNWSVRKTVLFTVLCGLGHVGSSVILGLIGIFFGIAIHKIQLWEGMRGSIVSYVFTAFGLVYFIWGLKRSLRNKPHTHLHMHAGGDMHLHQHTHHDTHLHVHTEETKINLTPWILFTIFIFGPCEPLIPLVMYPAAQNNYAVLILVTVVFSLITIGTMVTLVLLASYGIKILPMSFFEKYSHAVAGATIFLCGMGMLFLGL